MSSYYSRPPLKSQAREMLVALHDHFIEERDNNGPLVPFTRVNARVALALKVNKNTVTKVLKEKYGSSGAEFNALKTPKKKFVREKYITEPEVFRVDAVRRHVYNYFLRAEIPSVRKLSASLHEAKLFDGQQTSLRKFLKRIGFCYKQSKGRQIIMDRSEISLPRCKFFRQVKDLDWDSVVYCGEMWISDKISSVDGLTKSPVSMPLNKQQHLVLCHAGTADGFVNNALMAFVTKKAPNKYDEMQPKLYINWFETQLLPNIRPSSVIMINDTPYNSIEIDKAPTVATPVADITSWLARHNIPCGGGLRKPELLHLVKLAKTSPTYLIDQIALRHGHKVIRTPPFHCIYNPIELIWAQVKSYIADTKEQPGVETESAIELVKQSLGYIGPADWQAFIANTKQKVDEDWETYGLLEEKMDEFLSCKQEYSDTSDSESEIEEL